MTMRGIRSALALLAASVLLQGCANLATGPQFVPGAAPTDGQAVIYVFRPEQSYQNTKAPDMTIDKQTVGAIYDGGYLMLKVAPGQHTVTIPLNFWSWSDHCTPAIVYTQAGEVHYVQIELSPPSDFLGPLAGFETHCKLNEVTPEVALPLISQTRLSQQ